MKIQLLFLSAALFGVALLLSIINVATAKQQGQIVGNLSFQADIYGDSGLETIEYLSDLGFHSFGGFGTNAHIYRARLHSGDEIAYAISKSNPYAFSMQATPNNGDPVTLTLTNDAYSAGIVTMPNPNEMNFTWEIEQSGLHFNIHRKVTLASNSAITAQFVIREIFLVENLGPAFTLNSFSEYLHMDDRVAAQDYDCDGISETLLAINTYSSNAYPLFGKLYEQESDRYTQISTSGNFATVETLVNGTLGLTFSNIGEEKEISAANYVSSTAKDGSLAEQQITNDIKTLLGGGHFPNRWSLRSYNTDDRGAAFVNGLMVVGSRYSLYPDSGWVNICKHWNNEGNNFVSFASFDLGGCCNATYGFGIKQNDEVVWTEQGSTSTNLGITYNKIIQVSASGVISEYQQVPPPTPPDGDWELTIRASGGFAFALIDKLPVAGSTNNTTQTINITSLLDEQINHIHFNAWDDGSGNHEWYFAVSRNGSILWENTMQVGDGTRGLSKYIHLIIDETSNVNPLPQLALPFSYLPLSPRSAFMSRTKSVFDHDLPLGFSGQDGNNTVTSYLGITRNSSSATAITSYDQHNGYDFSGWRITDGQVRAPADGTITWGYDSNALYSCTLNGITYQTRSCMATIDHGDGWQSRFLHLARTGGTDRNPVCRVGNTGQEIHAGETIGQVGNTGCSTASHIHMEVLYNDTVMDPSGWLGENNTDPWGNNEDGTASFELWENLFPPAPNSWFGVNVTNGATLTSTSDTSITLPAGAFSGTWDFTYFDTPVSEPNNNLLPTGHSFIFDGMLASSFLTSMNVATADYTFTIPYKNSEVSNIRENTLQLYWWNNESENWEALPTSVNMTTKTTVATVNRFGLFALLGEDATSYLYLPFITK